MRRTLLSDPFAQQLISEDNFKFEAAHVVRHIHTIIQRLQNPLTQGDERDKRVFEAYQLLVRLESKPVSTRQRMQISFAFSLLYANDSSYTQSLRRLEQAREIAEQTGDQEAQIRLFRQEGEVYHRNAQLTPALDSYARGLALVTARDHELTGAMGHSDPMMELDLLVRLSGLELEKAQFDAMRHHIRLAHGLFEIVGRAANPLKAKLAWVETQDLRRQGRYHSALDKVGRVIERLERSLQNEAPTPTLARAQLVAMGTALDVAATFPALSTVARGYLAQAKVYRDQAQAALKVVDDPIAVGLLKLENHRYLRASKPDSNQMNMIEQAMYRGEILHDAALLGRAYTALGQELEAHGDSENARDAYRFARYLLTRHDFISLSYASEEALNRLGM